MLQICALLEGLEEMRRGDAADPETKAVVFSQVPARRELAPQRSLGRPRLLFLWAPQHDCCCCGCHAPTHRRRVLLLTTPASAPARPQFTSFLDEISAHLLRRGWASLRLDGSMPQKQRAAAIANWRLPNASGAPRVLLVSLRAGGTGLNLTHASHCFLMDLWWNEAADLQAMDRVHRLGQTRPVRVVRLVAERTVEERILELQQAKSALGRGALQKLSAEEARQARISDLKSLFDL